MTTTQPDGDVRMRRLVVVTTDFGEAQRTTERVFLPTAMWPMEPLRAVDMDLCSSRVHDMMTSTVRFGRDTGLRAVEAGSSHVAAPFVGVAESRVGSAEPIEASRRCAVVFLVDRPIDIRWPGGCAQMCLDFPRHALQRRLEQHLDRSVGRPLAFDPARDLTTPRGRGRMRMLQPANREARRQQGLLDHPLAAKSVEAAVVDGLLLAQPHNYSDALLQDRRVAPPRAVREAVELLETYPVGPGPHPCWSARSTAASVRCRRVSTVPWTPRP